jgi:cell wall-associated NlpC family hydrolase
MATPDTLPASRIITRREVVEAARECVDLPYRHQGHTKRGLDCIGLIILVAQKFGFDTSIPRGYSSQPQARQVLVGAEATLWKPEDQSKIQPGDIAVFWGWMAAEPQHFTIIGQKANGLTVIHAYSKFMKVVEQGWNPVWASRFHSRYVLPGTEEEWR